MKIPFPGGQVDAQAFCDKTHTAMIAADPLYAKSAQLGQTVRWDSPRRDLNPQGDPVGLYYVIVKDRIDRTMTPGERGAVVQAVKDAKA